MTPPIASRTHPTVLPWAAAAGTMLLWASSFVVIRGAADVFAPGSMALLRMAAASCVLVVWGVVVRPVWPRTPRAWALIACWGVAWFALYTITLNAAGHHVDAATASMVVNLAPLLVALAAVSFLGEAMSRRLLVGILFALLGIALITVATSAAHITITGLGLSLLCALLYAGSVLTQKKWLSRLESHAVTVGGVLAGTLACAPFAGELVRDLQDAPTAATASIVYLGVFPTAIAFTFWGFAIRHLPAGPLSSSSLIVPAIVVVMAWLILGETPPPLAALGSVLCLTDAGQAIFRPRRRASAAA